MTRLTSAVFVCAMALNACDAAAPVDDTSATEADSPVDSAPDDTEEDSTTEVPAWTPDPTQCFETQLAAEDPERIDVSAGVVMSCQPRWLHEQHCYGVPDAPNDRFPLEWEPWAHRYGFHTDGTKPEDGFDVLDHDPPPKTVLGPDAVCFYLDDSYLYGPDIWDFAGWSIGGGRCTVEVVQQCRCNAAGEPDDPACLEISVP